MKKKIVLICPTYNEIENINIFFERFSKIFNDKLLNEKYEFQLLFADNNSSDGSIDEIKLLSHKYDFVSYLSYSRNFGAMKSIYTAIRNLRDDTDACAVFDCDLQDPPDLIYQFIEAWEKDNKIVYGIRKGRNEKWTLNIFRKIFKKIDIYFRGYEITIESGAWFLDKKIINQFKITSFDQYLPGLLSRFGFKKKGIEYDRNIRERGKTKFGFVNYFSYALDGIFNGSIAPLRISVIFCVLFCSLFFLSSIYFVLAKFFFGIEFDEGIAAIAIINLFGFSIIFLILSILCEYAGRIYKPRFDQDDAIIEEKFKI